MAVAQAVKSCPRTRPRKASQAARGLLNPRRTFAQGIDITVVYMCPVSG
jgi:hypothetical protein